MIQIQFVFLTLIGIFFAANAETAYCRSQLNAWSRFGQLTECLATDVKSTEPKTELTIDLSRNLNNFTSLYFYNSPRFHYIPSNVHDKFPNIILLVLGNAGLKQLTNEDLKPLSNLRGLIIDSSQLTSLDKDVFIYSEKLELLSLQRNKFKSIEADTFKPLKILTSLAFTGNECLSKNANDRDSVEKLFREIEEKCKARVELLTPASLTQF